MLPNRSNQRGVALLFALFALLLVTGIAMGLMFLADTETSINSNYRDEQMAFYSAKAGLEEVRDRIRSNAGAGISLTPYLPAVLPGAAGGVLYVLNPANGEAVTPWSPGTKYFDDEVCKEVNCAGGQVPTAANWYVTPAPTANAAYAANPVLPYKWMRITLKTNQAASGTANTMYVNGSSSPTSANYQVCWNGTNELASAGGCVLPNKPVYMLTVLSLSPSGSRRMVQYEVTQDSLNLSFPAALTFDGQGDSFSGPDSNPYHVDGSDHPGCGGAATQAPKPAIGVPDIVDVATTIVGIPPNRLDHYTGSGPWPNVQNVSATMPSNLQTVTGLEGLIATIKNNATQVIQGPASGLSNPGSPSAPEIIYVNGDLSLSGNITGYGILVVTGTYTSAGTDGWRGLVLVVGQGSMVVSGGGSNEYDGAVLIAKTRDTQGNLLPSLGGTTLNWSGGGGNGVYYSSGCVGSAETLADYRVLAARELMY
jgi:hypothetical protein